jgi:hypothetical protein
VGLHRHHYDDDHHHHCRAAVVAVVGARTVQSVEQLGYEREDQKNSNSFPQSAPGPGDHRAPYQRY